MRMKERGFLDFPLGRRGKTGYNKDKKTFFKEDMTMCELCRQMREMEEWARRCEEEEKRRKAFAEQLKAQQAAAAAEDAKE